MNITTKLKYNTTASLINRIALLISGLIIPRLILRFYGVEAHGLTSSINQFLSVITFLDLGVGAVVQSSLYRPLAENDKINISAVLAFAKKYFRNIAYVLIVYVTLLVFLYPLIIDKSLNFLPTAFLIIAMSISTFSQYYFGLIYELLLNADQKSYIEFSAETITIVMNLLVSIFLITNGVSLQIVKLSASLIYLLRPIYLKYYVDKNYDININTESNEESIKDKWSGMAQHIAYTITNSTDIVVLTVFSNLENISIYAVYHMVINGINLLINSFTNNFKAFFGNLLAEESKLLTNYFSTIEWLVHTLVTYLYGMTAVLIIPFIMIYTAGVEGTNYNVPTFSIVLVVAMALNSIRTPYQALILGAGHFRETQASSIIEAVIKIFASLFLVNQFGLTGVAIGTVLATAYRTFYLVVYLSKNIINRPIKKFAKHLVVDALIFITMVFTGNIILGSPNNLIEWIWSAVLLGVIFIILTLTVNMFFYQKQTLLFVKKVLKNR